MAATQAGDDVTSSISLLPRRIFGWIDSGFFSHITESASTLFWMHLLLYYSEIILRYGGHQ